MYLVLGTGYLDTPIQGTTYRHLVGNPPNL